MSTAKSTFSPHRSTNIHRSGPLTASGMSRHQVERIVNDYLRRQRFVCSPEYRLGMIDVLCHRAFGAGLLARFRRGTTQADAYMAGVEHGIGISVPQKGGE